MDSKSAVYTGFQFESENFPALAIINTDLKNLPDKYLYAYSVFISIVPERINEQGHPMEEEYAYIVNIENKIIDYLENETRTVHVGHITLFKRTEIIFYTKDGAIVEDYLEHFLPTIEREYELEVEEDREWKNVSSFFEVIKK